MTRFVESSPFPEITIEPPPRQPSPSQGSGWQQQGLLATLLPPTTVTDAVAVAFPVVIDVFPPVFPLALFPPVDADAPTKAPTLVWEL